MSEGQVTMGTHTDRRRLRRHQGRPDDVTSHVLATTPRLLSLLSDEHRQIVVRAGHGCQVAPGELISSPGGGKVTVILRGVAVSRSTTVDGDQFIDALVGPGEIHGLTASLGHPEVADELVAITAVDALVIPGQTFRHLIAVAPEVTNACLEVITEEHAASRGVQALFASSSAVQRVEHRLVQLAERYGLRDGDRVIVTLPLTQEALASWAHTSRESCAKALHDLRRAGIVTTGRRQLVIEDLDALRARRRRDTTDRIVATMLRGTAWSDTA